MDILEALAHGSQRDKHSDKIASNFVLRLPRLIQKAVLEFDSTTCQEQMHKSCFGLRACSCPSGKRVRHHYSYKSCACGCGLGSQVIHLLLRTEQDG